MSVIQRLLARLRDDPSDVVVINELGMHFMQIGRLLEAIECFQRAAPTLHIARLNLCAAKASAVDRWHWKMLNDTNRNLSYSAAIKALAKRGGRALDIGAGTGLMSMILADSGVSVTAVEASQIMHKILCDTLACNGAKYAGVKPLLAHSTSLRVAGMAKPDLVVSEVVDCGLFGEGIIPTLRHAMRELGSSSTAYVPAGASMYFQMVESPCLRRAAVLDASVATAVPFSFVGTAVPYSAIDMSTVPHRVLSSAQVMFHIGLDGRAAAVLPDGAPRVLSVLDDDLLSERELSFTFDSAGVFDGIVTWFELHLTPASFAAALRGDCALPCSIRSSNAPGTSSALPCRWDQAIFHPVDASTGLACAPAVAAGQEATLSFRIEESLLCVRCAVASTVAPVATLVTIVSEECMALLNDEPCNAAFARALQSCVPGARVLDLTTGFSRFPFMAAQAGAAAVDVCGIDDALLLDAMRRHAQMLAVEAVVALYVPDRSAGAGLPLITCHPLGPSAPIVFAAGTRTWDCVLVDVLGPAGQLRHGAMLDVVYAGQCLLSPAASRTRFIPSGCRVLVRLVDCDELRMHARVDSSAALGFSMRPIDEFAVTSFEEFDLAHTAHTALSDDIAALCIDFEELCEEGVDWQAKVSADISVPIVQAGKCNAIVMYLELQVGASLVSTGATSAWKQCASLLQDDIAVCDGDVVTLRVSCTHELAAAVTSTAHRC